MELLGDILGLTNDELSEAIEKGQGFPYEPVRIQRAVPPETVVAIEENRFNLPGIFIEEEPVREYLQGSLAAHVLGYLGVISASELQFYGTTYRGSDLVGKSGIERTYEELLRGEIGTMTVEVNALSRPIRTVNVLEPVPGHNIVLTLDAHCCRERQKRLSWNTFKPSMTTQVRRPVHVLAMNPKTGISWPWPASPATTLSCSTISPLEMKYYSQLIADARLPLFNRATQALYGPGSTFKPITALAILEEGILGPKDRFNATGVSQYGVKDWVIEQRPGALWAHQPQ